MDSIKCHEPDIFLCHILGHKIHPQVQYGTYKDLAKVILLGGGGGGGGWGGRDRTEETN